MTLKIAIAGVAGRMGRALVQASSTNDAVKVTGGSELAGSEHLQTDIGFLGGVGELGAVPSSSISDAAAAADTWIDFTVPAATLSALEALVDTPVKTAIIGTTGLSPDDEARIAEYARRIAIVKAGNFSVGVNLMTALVQQAAERLDNEWDIEIFEAHHHHKIDAPSGTALMIGEAAASGRGVNLDDVRSAPYDGITGARDAGSIGFSVSRSGGIIGDHSASFGSEHEILTVGHRALDRSIFAQGALHAALWANNRSPGLYSMRDVLSL